MKAKTRAENEAEGEVGGSAQMVSCQRPAVHVCVCVPFCVFAAFKPCIFVHAACMWSACLPLLSCVHPCICVCVCVCVSAPSELRRGTVCAQSCSSQMALANRHCKDGRVGTTTQCTVGTASHHALPYVPGRGYLLPAARAH